MQHTLSPYVFATGVLGFFISFLAVFLTRRIALRRGILDIPNARSSHSSPTPRGGGVAVVLIALAGAIALSASSSREIASLGFYPLAAIIIAAISLIDDLRSVSMKFRFLTHGLCAALVLYGWKNWNIAGLQFADGILFDLATFFIAFLWIVGLTNSFNFMDGIDGIAGGQAAVAGFGWLLLGSLNEIFSIAIIGLLIGCASLGFLLHNWQPARIFMGDVGSTFLGFSFAVFPLFAIQVQPDLGIPGVLLVWPFVFDTVYTFSRRLLKGEKVFEAHRSHLYQRLVIAGYSHAAVSSIYIGLASIGLVLALYWSAGFRGAGIAVSALIPTLSILLLYFVSHSERRVTGCAAGRSVGRPISLGS